MARNKTTAPLGLNQKFDRPIEVIVDAAVDATVDRTANGATNRQLSRARASLAIAVMVGLSLFGGTRAFDSLRAASHFFRTRKGPAISLLCFDREIQFAQDHRYAVARARR